MTKKRALLRAFLGGTLFSTLSCDDDTTDGDTDVDVDVLEAHLCCHRNDSRHFTD